MEIRDQFDGNSCKENEATCWQYEKKRTFAGRKENNDLDRHHSSVWRHLLPRGEEKGERLQLSLVDGRQPLGPLESQEIR